jgi:uncharacterized membrane protein YeaQ/YmgE (transglycosylase-associated protein family)
MVTLSILWILLGIAIGALAIAARLRPSRWGPSGWRILLLIGAIGAFIGGWLGTLAFGRFFGTATSVWVAVLCVVVIPLAARRLNG